MKKFKRLLRLESGELKIDLKMKITVLLLIFSFTQIDINANSLNSEKGNTQQKVVKGKVLDASGEPLPGASVQVKGTSNGVQTSFDGEYTININSDSKVLIFSYLGFIAQEVAIDGRSTINVTLLEDNTSLDEIVIVGYGQQRKKDIAGSISTIKT